jgi:hypothetical protein
LLKNFGEIGGIADTAPPRDLNNRQLGSPEQFACMNHTDMGKIPRIIQAEFSSESLGQGRRR